MVFRLTGQVEVTLSGPMLTATGRLHAVNRGTWATHGRADRDWSPLALLARDLLVRSERAAIQQEMGISLKDPL